MRSNSQFSAYWRTGARADETRGLDRHAGLLHDVDDRLDVGADGARGAIGDQRQLRIDDLPRQPQDVAHHVRSRAGESDVRRLDAQTGDQVQDLELVLDRRRAHRRALQAVAQGLVVQLDTAPRRREILAAGAVPVVDQFGFLRIGIHAAQSIDAAICRSGPRVAAASHGTARSTRSRPPSRGATRTPVKPGRQIATATRYAASTTAPAHAWRRRRRRTRGL